MTYQHASPTINDEPQKRLSPWRVMLALCLLIGIGYGSIFGWKWWKETEAATAKKPWFAAYVDVTAKPTYDFEQLGSTTTPNVVLSFIVSSNLDPCTPLWGAVYTPDEARTNFDLDRRIARLRQQGGNVAISFGGLKNDELALKCTDPNKLLQAYQSIVDRYKVDTIDLDLENSGLTDKAALKRRADVIAKLQKNRRAKGKSLAVWLTFPVAPHGMTEDGTNAVAQMLKSGVDLAGVNVMTMDYGASKGKNQSMKAASEQALKETHRQLGVLYQQAGIRLNSVSLWRKIGATPMIGQNDVRGEVFSIDDAKGFNAFTTKSGIGRISMWSANRDLPCGGNYIDVKVVSDSCSGVKQEKMDFAMSLSKEFDGNMSQNAKAVTTADKDATIQKADDPKTSPYQIWNEKGAYLQGTKVVWHRNVYTAKWWTQGDMPDDPVLQSWQTPWQLVGPVLPGEKPIKQLSLPAGTYQSWDGEETYEAGTRVMFEGTPYQAKWWNQGDSPAAASANADNSPWTPLTQDQIKATLGETN